MPRALRAPNLRCPHCKSVGPHGVTNTQAAPFGDKPRMGRGLSSGEASEVLRQRKCSECANSFTTRELVEVTGAA